MILYYDTTIYYNTINVYYKYHKGLCLFAIEWWPRRGRVSLYHDPDIYAISQHKKNVTILFYVTHVHCFNIYDLIVFDAYLVFTKFQLPF